MASTVDERHYFVPKIPSRLGTFHTGGRFPGRSPPSNRGPSTLEAIFPDGHRLGCGMKPDGAIPHRAGVVRLDRGVRWTGAWVTGWKRGRPFPRAARSFHQPPQLAGSAAAPPAPPELTLFTLNLTGKVSVVSVKKRRLLIPRPPSVKNIGLFCLPKSSLTSDLPGFGAPMWIVPT